MEHVCHLLLQNNLDVNLFLSYEMTTKPFETNVTGPSIFLNIISLCYVCFQRYTCN